MKKVMINRDEKIEKEIIKPKDELITKLYYDNVTLKKELFKQVNLVSKAEIYKSENADLVDENKKLLSDYKILKQEFNIRTSTIEKKIISLVKKS